jgi:antitoxin component YwqK of YwqJK toxin-antitoxin module
MKKFIIFTLLWLISCNQQKKEITYYKNGNVFQECEIVNNRRNGICTEFYNNGKISSITEWKNDTLNGLAKYFYSSGNLKLVCNYKSGVRSGSYKEFYETGKLKEEGEYIDGFKFGIAKEYDEQGLLKYIKNYMIEQNQQSINEYIKFYPNGDTNYRESNFFIIKCPADTIKIGDTFTAELYLIAPYFKNSKIFAFFELPNDSTVMRRIFSDNYRIQYDFTPKDTGNYKMEGYLEEILMKDDTTFSGKSRHLYFEYPYYVAPSDTTLRPK